MVRISYNRTLTHYKNGKPSGQDWQVSDKMVKTVV